MPTVGGPQVVGRGDEIDRLRSLADEAAAGRGRLVLIEGEPGIGKTAVLRAFFETAAPKATRAKRRLS